MSGTRTAWFPSREMTQAGVSGVASIRASTASAPIRAPWGEQTFQYQLQVERLIDGFSYIVLMSAWTTTAPIQSPCGEHRLIKLFKLVNITPGWKVDCWLFVCLFGVNAVFQHWLGYITADGLGCFNYGKTASEPIQAPFGKRALVQWF